MENLVVIGGSDRSDVWPALAAIVREHGVPVHVFVYAEGAARTGALMGSVFRFFRGRNKTIYHTNRLAAAGRETYVLMLGDRRAEWREYQDLVDEGATACVVPRDWDRRDPSFLGCLNISFDTTGAP